MGHARKQMERLNRTVDEYDNKIVDAWQCLDKARANDDEETNDAALHFLVMKRKTRVGLRRTAGQQKAFVSTLETRADLMRNNKRKEPQATKKVPNATKKKLDVTKKEIKVSKKKEEA